MNTGSKFKGEGKKVSCYNKEYASIRALARDFGIDDKDMSSYNKLAQLIRKGTKPENAIETVLESINARDENTSFKITEKEVEQMEMDINKPIGGGIVVLDGAPNDYPKNNNPIYFNIKDHIQLIEELKHMNIHKINLIDFENMVDDFDLLKPHINEENTINIFFYNACIYSNQFFKIIKYTHNINLQVLIYDHENQLVDHLITFYLGALMAAFPDKHFTILSKDFGFYPFVNSLNKGNIGIAPNSFIEDKEERYKFSLCKYIANNKYLQNRDCIRKSEFVPVFESFNNKKEMSSKDVNDLINSLIKFKVLFEINQKGHLFYKFDMNAVKRVVYGYLE